MSETKTTVEVCFKWPKAPPPRRRCKDFPVGTWLLVEDGRLLLVTGFSECFLDVRTGSMEQMDEFVDFDYVEVANVTITAELVTAPHGDPDP